MGNKLHVDTKVSEIEEILNYSEENELKLEPTNNSFSQPNEPTLPSYQNLKVWRFYEGEDDVISSQAILLPNIREERFLLSSSEAYIILLVYRGKYDLSEISAFPTSLWGIVESSSNMTPRGLKYAFSTSSNKSESLESFLLSKRDFKDSDFKYVLFIWNGKNCTAILKSFVLMKAFDMDKKLSNSSLLPYLYSGYWIENSKLQPGKQVKMNEIISNTLENLTDDSLLTPSSETVFNYQETVYLLQWLYPINKKSSKRSANKNKPLTLFQKFNTNFLENSHKSFYDLFVKLEKEKSEINTKRNETDRNPKEEDSQNEESEENSLHSLNDVEEDLNINLEDAYSPKKIITSSNFPPKEKLKINLGEINNFSLESSRNIVKKDKTYSSTETNSTSNKIKACPNVPKLNMKFQHKVLNDEIISQRTKQISKDEEKLDSLSSNTIRRASDLIINKENIVMKKLDLKNLKKTGDMQKSSERCASNYNAINSNNNQLKINNLKIPTRDNNFPSLQINIEPSQEHRNNIEMTEQELEEEDTYFNKEENNLKNVLDDTQEYDLRESERKKVLMDYFSKNMSEIIEEFLFLSSYNVAQNKELICQNKITHIINAAADVCLNHFEEEEMPYITNMIEKNSSSSSNRASNKISYLSFNLKDHSMENIECLFYEVINFINNAKEKGGRVLVHCIQGISRSVSLVLAYIIFTRKINYDDAFKLVQARRSIASPNLGFSIQLQNFYQRLFEPPSSFRLLPKIFAVGSFQLEQPEKIVCRLVNFILI
jgi:protein-tyrosine phosphatase